MSDLREALEKLIRDNSVVDRRPRDKHGPIGRLPEARIPTSILKDLLAAHPEPATGVTCNTLMMPSGFGCSLPSGHPGEHSLSSAPEPVMRVTEQATFAALRAYEKWSGFSKLERLRAALEAAQPFLGVQRPSVESTEGARRPVVDREALADVIQAAFYGTAARALTFEREESGKVADKILALLAGGGE